MGAMISRRGCIRVQALADRMGLSLRQFERRFAAHVGISPKVYARILRFETAIHRKSISAVTWTSIAHELGYCNQVHMIHDFQSLSRPPRDSLVQTIQSKLPGPGTFRVLHIGSSDWNLTFIVTESCWERFSHAQ
jgi:hypothetical protein